MLPILFSLNEDYIITELCSGRFDDENTCLGSCVKEKAVKRATEHNSTSPNQKNMTFSKWLTVLAITDGGSEIPFPKEVCIPIPSKNPQFAIKLGNLSSVFVPPKLS